MTDLASFDPSDVPAPGLSRRGAALFAAGFAFIAAIGYFVAAPDVLSRPMQDVVHLIGSVFIGAGPLVLAYRVGVRSVWGGLFAAGGGAIIVSQFLAVAEDMNSIAEWPVMGKNGAFHVDYLDNVILSLGMFAIVLATYLTASYAVALQRAVQSRKDVIERALSQALSSTEALVLSEQRFRNLAADAPLIIWTANAQGHVTYLNQAWSNLTGKPASEGLGDGWRDFVHPDDLASLLVFSRNGRGALISGETRFRLRTPAGDYRHLRGTSIPVAELIDGSPGFIGFSLDITGLVEAQEAYEALVSNSLQGMIILQDDRIVFANGAMTKVVGVGRESLIGLTMAELDRGFHRDDREAIWEDYRQRLAGRREPIIHRWRIFRADGTMRWIEAETAAIRYRGKTAVQSLMLDITEQMRVEEALRESEERLRLIMQATLDGVYDVRLARNNWWYSDRYTEHFGPPAAYPEMNSYEVWAERLHPADRTAVLESFAAAVADGATSWESTHRMRRQDGSYGYFRDHCMMEWDGQGAIVRTVGAVKDVTAQRLGSIRLETIAAIAQMLFGADDERNVWTAIVRTLCERLGLTAGFVALLEPAGRDITFTAYHGPSSFPFRGARYALARSKALRALETQRIVAEDLDGDWGNPREAAVVSLLGLRQCVFVPLVVNGNSAGVIALASAETLELDDSLHQTLEIVANTVSQWLAGSRTRQALNASQQRYAMATAAASVGVLDWKIEEDELYIDPVLEELLGYRSPPGHTWKLADVQSLLANPEQAAEMHARLNAHIQGLAPEYQMEERLISRDGEERWFLVQGTALRNAEGKAVRMVGTATDITRLKEAEIAAQRQRELLLLLANNLPALVAYIGPDMRYRFVNECYRAWYGVDPAALVGKTPESVIGAAEFAAVRADHERALAGERVHFVRRMPVGERGMRWLSIDLIPAPDIQDQGYGYVGLVTDIIESKLAQEALLESRKLLAESQRIGHIGSWTWQPGDTAITASEELFAIHGLTECGKPEARHFLRLIHPDDRATIRQFALARLTEGTPGEHLYRIVRPDGEERVMRVWIEQTSDSAGNVLRVTGVTQDVTEQIAVEERVIEAAESERRRFGEDLHDDIGQYLTGMVLLARSLARTLRESGIDAYTAAEDLERHIQHCRERARAVARGLRPIPQERNGLFVAMNDLCAQLEDLFHVACSVQSGPGVIVDDVTTATHLFRIAQEAATNAIHHGKATEVRFVFEDVGGQLHFVVLDNGKGLDRGVQTPHGTGLSIMHHRASLLHGTLTVENDRRGGVRVVCTVPSSQLGHRRTA